MEGSNGTDTVPTVYECQIQNCDWSGTVRDMKLARPLSGDVDTANFCPQCNGRIFLTTKELQNHGKAIGIPVDDDDGLEDCVECGKVFMPWDIENLCSKCHLEYEDRTGSRPPGTFPRKGSGGCPR